MSANIEQIYQDFEDCINFISPKEVEPDKQKESFINLRNHHPFEKTKKIQIPFKKNQLLIVFQKVKVLKKIH